MAVARHYSLRPSSEQLYTETPLHIDNQTARERGGKGYRVIAVVLMIEPRRWGLYRTYQVTTARALSR